MSDRSLVTRGLRSNARERLLATWEGLICPDGQHTEAFVTCRRQPSQATNPTTRSCVGDRTAMVATRSQHRDSHRYALLKGNLCSRVKISGTVTERGWRVQGLWKRGKQRGMGRSAKMQERGEGVQETARGGAESFAG